MPDLPQAQSEPATIEEHKVDKLSAALAEAANKSVPTDYGDIALARALKSGDFDIWASAQATLQQLGQIVTDLTITDERFPKDAQLVLRTHNGSMQFYPIGIGSILIQRTIDFNSSDEAIAWFLRVLEAKNAPGRVVEALWGVDVAEEFDLGENLRILPTTALKDGPFKDLLLGRRRGIREDLVMSSITLGNPQSVLEYRTELTSVVAPIDVNGLPPALSQETAISIREQMQEMTDFLTVIGPRVTLSAAITFEFDDPDLHYLGMFFLGRSMRIIEVMPVRPTITNPPLDIAEAIELAAIFVKLNQDLRKQLCVALNRLNLAQRRLSLGDKAIDLAITLESLLGGNENSEITHKVTTRATRLLAGPDNQRHFNRAIVNATYSYRSKMVHNGTQPSGIKRIGDREMRANEIISAAVDVCVKIIKAIIHRRAIPDWQEFDILNN